MNPIWRWLRRLWQIWHKLCEGLRWTWAFYQGAKPVFFGLETIFLNPTDRRGQACCFFYLKRPWSWSKNLKIGIQDHTYCKFVSFQHIYIYCLKMKSERSRMRENKLSSIQNYTLPKHYHRALAELQSLQRLRLPSESFRGRLDGFPSR